MPLSHVCPRPGQTRAGRGHNGAPVLEGPRPPGALATKGEHLGGTLLPAGRGAACGVRTEGWGVGRARRLLPARRGWGVPRLGKLGAQWNRVSWGHVGSGEQRWPRAPCNRKSHLVRAAAGSGLQLCRQTHRRRTARPPAPPPRSVQLLPDAPWRPCPRPAPVLVADSVQGTGLRAKGPMPPASDLGQRVGFPPLQIHGNRSFGARVPRGNTDGGGLFPARGALGLGVRGPGKQGPS